MSIPELSRIYPTPPSVETVMEVDKYDEAKEERTEHSCIANSTTAVQWDTPYVSHNYTVYVHVEGNFACMKRHLIFFYQDDDCVPSEFAPLSDLLSLTRTLPKQCIYTDRSAASTGGLNKTSSGNDIK